MPQLTIQQSKGKGLLRFYAHPEGSRAQLRQNARRVKDAIPEPLAHAKGKNFLIAGGTSFGYGSSIGLALHAAGARRIWSVGLESTKPTLRGGELSRASSGMYITDELHQPNGPFAAAWRTYFGNIFLPETKQRLIEDIQKDGGGVDGVFYSVAAPARPNPADPKKPWKSVIDKTVVKEAAYSVPDINYEKGIGESRLIEKATPADIENTRQVMGGEDYQILVGGLFQAGLLNPGAYVTTMSYIGAEDGIYWGGTMGVAKRDGERANRELQPVLAPLNINPFSTVAPAVVTTASGQLPGIIGYLSAYLAADAINAASYLDPVEVGILMAQTLYGDLPQRFDAEGRLRLDHLEFEPYAQQAIAQIQSQNRIGEKPEGLFGRGFGLYRTGYEQLFGFGVQGVDYDQPTEVEPANLIPERGVFDLTGNG